MTATALYRGSLTHVRRLRPAGEFKHDVYFLYLDLDELAGLSLGPMLGVESAGLLSFRRRDYRGDPALPLKQVILDEVERKLGRRPSGPVRLLTQVRTLGVVFNPVSFYYCFAADGETLEAVLAEITNTPWGERHAYVVAADRGEATSEFAKAFHVSPFLSPAQRYVWRLPTPGTRLVVEMANREGEREVFRARLSLERRPLTRASLVAAWCARPHMSLLTLAWIYGHAVRLWLVGARVYEHPKSGRLLSSEGVEP